MVSSARFFGRVPSAVFLLLIPRLSQGRTSVVVARRGFALLTGYGAHRVDHPQPPMPCFLAAATGSHGIEHTNARGEAMFSDLAAAEMCAPMSFFRRRIVQPHMFGRVSGKAAKITR